MAKLTKFEQGLLNEAKETHSQLSQLRAELEKEGLSYQRLAGLIIQLERLDAFIFKIEKKAKPTKIKTLPTGERCKHTPDLF